jgi:serine/threonine protein kinase
MGLFGGFKALLGSKVNIRDRFELLREAISGTMSSFYMARDRTTGQIVGLKVLDRKKTAQLEARFVGLKKPPEGEIAMQMKHPQIVRTLEHGITTNHEQFVVMEFLDGPGLNSLIVGRSPLLDGRRIQLLRQAADAIAAVHAAGFIHRDICPRNFVASKDVSNLKLIDFGLTVPATAPFMAPGNRTGTANYMAPEVVRRKPTSQTLDIFSFGVTAYEMCAFALPWPKGTGKEAMVHGTEAPTDIRKYRPNINPRLAEAIGACIESAPQKRPQSIEEFLKLIHGVQQEDVG